MVAALLVGGLPAASAAQRGAPLLKTDLIELLSSPVIKDREVADLVRRNCLAFRPTERDLVDLQRLGASVDVVESVTACAAAPLPRPVDGGARSTAASPRGPARGASAPPAPTFPGRPAVALVVRAGPPASVLVEPAEVVFDHGLDAIVPVRVLVRDSAGHPIEGEQVVLGGNAEGAAFLPDTSLTDSLGRAVLYVARGRATQGGTLQVGVAGRPLASVEVVVGVPLVSEATGFVSPPTLSGAIGQELGTPLVFEARTRLGRPAVGRTVTFRALNATVSPASAVTDSTGRARVAVSLGDRVGRAVVTARVDSIEKHLTLQVDPGHLAELGLEHNGARVDGRWLIVRLDTTFVVRVRPRDAFGNVTSVAQLARILREAPFNAKIPFVRLLSVQDEPTGVALTFLAIRPGRATVKLHAADVTALVHLEVVAVR